MDPEISVLIASREREESLFGAITSFMAKAADSRRLEFLLAIDPDEDAEIKFPNSATVSIWVAPERYGYDRLHEYYNELAHRSRGQWLLPWHDDAFMLTKGYDAVIASQECNRALWMQTNRDWHFGAWPRSWVQSAGHLSMSPRYDLWMRRVAVSSAVSREIPVDVFHKPATREAFSWAVPDRKACMEDAELIRKGMP